MTTSGVKAQSINLIEPAKSAKTSNLDKKSNKTSFEDFMNSSTNNKVDVKPAEVSSNHRGNVEVSDNKFTSLNKSDAEVDAAKSLVKAVSEEPQDDIANIEADDISAMLENMANIMSALQVTVSENLGVSEETLKQAMEELGLSATDLLDNGNLKQLVLHLNNSQDVTDLLTDESLGNSLSSLLEKVREFKSDNNLSEEKMEGFKEFATQITQLQDEVMEVEDNTDADKAPKVIVVKEEKPVQSENDSMDFKGHSSSDNGEKGMKSLNPADAFIQNLTARPLEDVGFTEQIARARQMQEITNQIVEQIKIIIRPTQTAMELQLNPENLGKVNLSVIFKDGVMTAQFTAQNEAVKEALESQIQILKDNFNNQGLKVESVEVTVSNFTTNDQTSSNTGEESKQSSQKNRVFRTMDDLSQNDEPVVISNGILDENTSSVDFIA